VLVDVEELIPKSSAIFSSQRRNGRPCNDEQTNQVYRVVHVESLLKGRIYVVILHQRQYSDPLIGNGLFGFFCLFLLEIRSIFINGIGLVLCLLLYERFLVQVFGLVQRWRWVLDQLLIVPADLFLGLLLLRECLRLAARDRGLFRRGFDIRYWWV